jgi:hypothetical protein
VVSAMSVMVRYLLQEKNKSIKQLKVRIGVFPSMEEFYVYIRDLNHGTGAVVYGWKEIENNEW